MWTCIQVLEAIEHLHSQGIVHGHLDPTHVVWFSTDFSWKLISLGHAGREEESSVPRPPSRYDSPETTRVSSQGRTQISLERATDMWSFGILAFEVFSRESAPLISFSERDRVSADSSVWEASRLVDYVDAHLSVPHFMMPGTSHQWMFDSWMGRSQHGDKQQELRFVQSFLRPDPNDRKTAAQATDDAVFLPGEDARREDHVCRYALSFLVSAARIFAVSVAVGRRGYQMIRAESPGETGADGVQALPRLSSVLNVLPPELRGGDCCLLHIRVSPSLDSPFRILRVQGISVGPIGHRSTDLQFRQGRMGPVVNVFARIPSSDRHNSTGDLGVVQQGRRCILMHLTLRIRLEVHVDGRFAQPVDVFKEIHCVMERRRRAFGIGRGLAWAKDTWKRAPQLIRFVTGGHRATTAHPDVPSRFRP